jgi:hypothetical protein
LKKEAFQKVLGDYGNHFGKKIVNRCFSSTIYSNCCYFDGHEQVRSDCSFVPKESKGECPAIIQKTTAAEKVGIGTVNTIQSVVAAKSLSSPAIVIGEVVRDAKRNAAFTRN